MDWTGTGGPPAVSEFTEGRRLDGNSSATRQRCFRPGQPRDWDENDELAKVGTVVSGPGDDPVGRLRHLDRRHCCARRLPHRRSEVPDVEPRAAPDAGLDCGIRPHRPTDVSHRLADLSHRLLGRRDGDHRPRVDAQQCADGTVGAAAVLHGRAAHGCRTEQLPVGATAVQPDADFARIGQRARGASNRELPRGPQLHRRYVHPRRRPVDPVLQGPRLDVDPVRRPDARSGAAGRNDHRVLLRAR